MPRPGDRYLGPAARDRRHLIVRNLWITSPKGLRAGLTARMVVSLQTRLPGESDAVVRTMAGGRERSGGEAPLRNRRASGLTPAGRRHPGAGERWPQGTVSLAGRRSSRSIRCQRKNITDMTVNRMTPPRLFIMSPATCWSATAGMPDTRGASSYSS